MCISILLMPYAQVETVINVPITSTATPTFPALLYLPDDYSTTGSQKYPLLIFFHGSGESCPPQSSIFNSTTAGGPPYLIEHGLWPTGGFKNYKSGIFEKFIVLSPQSNCNSWSTSGDQMNWIKTFMVQNYRVDSNRIYGTGLSSGGGGVIENVAHLDGNENVQNFPSRYPFAAVIPMSPATNNVQSAWMATMVHDSIPGWWFGDQINDVYGERAFDAVNFVNGIKAGYAYLTGNPGTNGQNKFVTGHGPWAQFYDPNYRETRTWLGVTSQSMNMYEWALLNVRNQAVITTPTANAGGNQNITQPTSSVTLSGTGTAGSGHTISSYAWSQISGPSCVITSPSTQSTTVTGMSTAGAYVFQFKVTNEISAFATSQMTVTVISNAPHANAGGDQTITLPASSVSLDGTGSTGGITSYAWTQLAGGPNTATINSPSAATTTVISMIAGTYQFQLSLNGGTSKDTVQVTVLPVQPCGPKRKIVVHPFSDSTYFHNNNDNLYLPGDTLVLSHADKWKSFVVINMNGASGCKIVIRNDSGTTLFTSPTNGHNSGNDFSGMQFGSCTNIHIDGTADPTTQYGFTFIYDSTQIYQTRPSITIDDKSKNVEVNNVYFHYVDIAIVAEVTENCDTTFNWPNWLMDSIIIHDNKVVGTWNEGFYLGNTSPDNAFYDHRPTVCGADTFYYKPAKNGYTAVYNNYVDSTGRSGIQLADAIVNPDGAVSEIYNNTIKHNGLNGDDAQGTGIDPGLYTVAKIHDNNITNTYTWGIASLGACGSNTPLQIFNNVIDSSGYLRTYDNSITDTFRYNPSTAPTFPDTLVYPYAIFITTKPISYTTDSLPGTGVKGLDSLQFLVKNNLIGLFKARTRPDSMSVGSSTAAIQIAQDSRNPTIQQQGNVVCNNSFFDETPATVFVDTRQGPIPFNSNCALPPTVGGTATPPSLTQPSNSITLNGSASGNAGATIVSHTWTQLSGPACSITNPNNFIASVTAMNLAGTYVFSLGVIDSNGTPGHANVTVVVSAPISPSCNCIPFTKGQIPAVKTN